MDAISVAIGFVLGVFTVFGFVPFVNWAKKTYRELKENKEN